jgi:hypothetical protein
MFTSCLAGLEGWPVRDAKVEPKGGAADRSYYRDLGVIKHRKSEVFHTAKIRKETLLLR